MLHLIQDKLFTQTNYENLISSLNRLNVNYKIVRVFPYIDKVVDLKDITEINDIESLVELEIKEPVWCWGSTNLTKICKKNGWLPGTMLNENHDYLYYRNIWKDDLLNYDSVISTIGDKIEWDTVYKFIRPTEDSKAFTGGIFDIEKWNNTKECYLNNPAYSKFNKDTKIQIGNIKNIQKEIRFWIVKDEIVTFSYYRLGGNSYLNNEVEPDAIKFVEKMISIGSVADAWVLDICLSDGEWKIVEVNCVNHSGFYSSDIDKIVNSIVNNFNI